MTTDIETTKGAVWYTRLEPGCVLGTGKQARVSVPLVYEMSTAVKVDGEEVPDSRTSALAAGISSSYALNARHSLAVQLLLPALGKNVYKFFYVAVTYKGDIPF